MHNKATTWRAFAGVNLSFLLLNIFSSFLRETKGSFLLFIGLILRGKDACRLMTDTGDINRCIPFRVFARGQVRFWNVDTVVDK